MYIVELLQPGTWLDIENRELRHRLGNLLDFVIRSLHDAAIALDMFETTRADTPSSDEHERRFDERWEASAALGFSENREQLLTEWKREKWASGQTPFDYRSRRPFLMARAFVGSLDGVSKGLKAMAEELDGQDLATAIEAALTGMALGIPDLSGVRNSANHQEDRLRFRNQKGPMTTTAIDLPAIKSSPGAMVADSLIGSNIAFTMANGDVGQVPVTSSTLRLVQELVQGLLNDLPWRGPPVHLPRE